MKNFYKSPSFYMFFLVTLTSGYATAYVYETNSNGRVKLAQDDSGDHIVWVSGCSFNQGSQGTMDAFFAMANWNNPKNSESVFRAEWVNCLASQESGRWSRKKEIDNGNRLMSQIVITDHLDSPVVGHIDQTRNFARNEVVGFTIFIRPVLTAGEINRCDSNPSANLRSNLNHELGHSLGLRHTQTKRWASMRKNVAAGYYCDIATNQTLTNPFPDDLAGLESGYGNSSILPQYRPVARDLAALAYENYTDSFATRSWISRADVGTFATRFCPGDTVPKLEFSVANRGEETLKYTRTFWSSPTPDLSSSNKSILWRHWNRTKSPGARAGIFQGRKDLYFNDSDLPPVGDVWFMVMQIHDVVDENNQPVSEDRTDNNAMVHSFKIRRHPSCP